MATSQNGYRANDRSLIASYKVPGGKISMRKGDVATVLSYVAKRFHSEVEKLKWPGNWGYAERKIRGGSSLSNHASGTAIDLNAPAHYLGARGTFSSTQLRAIRRILNDCEGVIRWGGDYRGRKDEMHFEINKGTAAVRSLANKIRAGKKPGPSGGATSGGSSSGSTTYKAIKYGQTLKIYTKGDVVKNVQEFFKLEKDGYFGPKVKAAVVKFQKSVGLKGDGIVGPATWKALKKAGMKIKYGVKKKTSSSSSKAPSFPLPSDHWYGVESPSKKNHSGYYAKDREGIKQFQRKLKSRGWSISVDGIYGPNTRKVVTQFQREKKGLTVDGVVGERTWAAIWNRPVT